MDQEQQNYAQSYPKELFEESEFTFTKSEQALLQTYSAIQAMGEMAKALITNFLNNICLPRVNKDPTKEMGLYYSYTRGIFITYVPKNYCNTCGKNAGRTEEDKKWYCNQCLFLKKVKEKETD